MPRVVKAGLIIAVVLICLFILLYIWGAKLYLKILEKNINNIAMTQTRINEKEMYVRLKVDLSEKSIPVLMDSMFYETLLFDTVISSGVKRFDPHKRYDREIVFPVTINNDILKRKIKEHQGQRTDVKMHIVHYLDIPLLGKRTVEVLKHIHMNLPVVPEANIKDVKIEKFGLDDMTMYVTVSVKNPNNMDFVVKEMSYQAQLKDYAFSSGKTEKNFHIRANATSEVTVPVHTDMKHEVKALWKSLKGETEWPYHLSTQMTLKPGDSRISDIRVASEKRGVVDIGEAMKAMKNKEKIGVGEHR